MFRRLVFAASLGMIGTSAPAMVGGAPPATQDIARHVVMIVGSRGNACTGTAVAGDLVLTAAHCVLAGAEYKLVDYDASHQPLLKDVSSVARHPQFDVNAVLAHRVTADVGLLKLTEPLPARLVPVELSERVATAPGESFVVAGFGVTVRGDGRTGGTLRAATLVSTGQPGALQLRLTDPATRNSRSGRGACTGDSGAPVFEQTGGRWAVLGLVSWSTGPNNADGCGGLTGVTPLARYRGWISEQAARFGSALSSP